MLYSLQAVCVPAWEVKCLLRTLNTPLLHIFLMRLPLYDLSPASGQTWLTLLAKVRTEVVWGGEPPAHQTLNKTTSLAPFLLYHTRSSHAGYASAISMQPVAWPVWRRTHTRARRSALLMRCQSVRMPAGLWKLKKKKKGERERKPSWGVCAPSHGW